ncbi:MAG: sensor histidine kinase [Phycisphaerales bacterium JB059]
MRAKNDRLAELTLNAQQFVNDVAHEFRTPLAVIKEFAAIIADGIGGDVTSTQRGFLEFINGATVDLAHLVDDFLDTGKLRSGTLRVSRRGCSPVAILDETWPILESRAKTKGVTLVREVCDEVPQVFADPEKAGRTLVNLVTNAIKFSDEQGRVVIRVAPEPDAVRVSVIDEGPGLSEKDVADLFERFRQGPSARRISEKGFGLGLSIVKDLVGVNLGTVHIASVPGEGSEFSFTLPLDNHRSIVSAVVGLASQRDRAAPITGLIVACESGDASTEERMRWLEDVTYCTDVLLPIGDGSSILLIGQTSESHNWIKRLEAELAGDCERFPRMADEHIRFRRIGVWSVNEAESELVAAAAALQGGVPRVELGSHR